MDKSIPVQQLNSSEIEALKEFVYLTGGGQSCRIEQSDEHSPIFCQEFSNQAFTNQASQEKPVAYGRIRFGYSDNSSACYVKVPWKKDTKISCVQSFALLYFVEKVWRLARPKLLISITGGAEDFALDASKEHVLYQLMETARNTDAWLITGGSNVGIMKHVGEARRRYGGNIPLFGIGTWGTIRHGGANETQEAKGSAAETDEGRESVGKAMLGTVEKVETEVTKKTVSCERLGSNCTLPLGYTTKAPIPYFIPLDDTGKKCDRVQLTNLDPNHSHFILVDDGTQNRFGGEVELRGQFQSSACLPPGDANEHLIARALRENQLGWEGGEGLWTETQQFDAHIMTQGASTRRAKRIFNLHRQAEKKPAVCLCFEGGPYSIHTVAEASRHGTPALLVNKSGRAADLLSDCLRVYESGDFELLDSMEPEKERQSEPARANDTQYKLINRLILLANKMYDIRCSTHKFTVTVTSDESVDEICSRHRTQDACSDADCEKTIRASVQCARLLFDKYNIFPRTTQEPLDSTVLKLVFELFDCLRSGTCLVYDKDAKVEKEGHLEAPDVLEFMVKCIISGFEKQSYLARMGLIFSAWKTLTVLARLSSWLEVGELERASEVDESKQAKSALLWMNVDVAEVEKFEILKPERMEEVKSSTVEEVKSSTTDQTSMNQADQWRCRLTEDLLDIDMELKTYPELRLLIKLDQMSLLTDWLDNSSRSPASVDRRMLLNRGLHKAVLHNKSKIVHLLLSRGADPEIYSSHQASDLSHQASDLWKELLVREYELSEDNFLRSLMPNDGPQHSNWISKSSGKDLLHFLYLKVLTPRSEHARRILLDVFKHQLRQETQDVKDTYQLDFECGIEFDLYMLMLLLNRPEMANIFWMKTCKKTSSSLLQCLLTGCLLCRNLSKIVAQQRLHHLRHTFAQTADKIEDVAACLLRRVYDKNSKRALQSLEQPLLQPIFLSAARIAQNASSLNYQRWSSVDLFAQADCTKIIERCPEICIEAIQRRFTGSSSIHAAIVMRWNMIEKWFPVLYGSKWHDTFGFRLLICVMIDAVGIAIHICSSRIPSIALVQGLVLACAVSVQFLFGKLTLSILVLLGRTFSFVSMLPTATMACLWAETLSDEATANTEKNVIEMDSEINNVFVDDRLLNTVPFDHYIQDVMAHILQSALLTFIIYAPPTFPTFAFEILLMSLFIMDELPDIVLAGINDDAKTLSQVFKKGVTEHIRTGYVIRLYLNSAVFLWNLKCTTLWSAREIYEFLSMVLFVIGFGCRFLNIWTIEFVLAFSFTLMFMTAILWNATRLLDSDRSMKSFTDFFKNHFASMQASPSHASEIEWGGISVVVAKALLVGYPGLTGGGKWEMSPLLYGFSGFLMWLRALQFFCVQKELGQFVTVMIEMARDLTFFGIIWGVLVLAFSTAILGADVRKARAIASCSEGTLQDSSCALIQQWDSWWLLRTYLQSLSQDYIGEMKSDWSNLIFLIMWPIFNVLLVNLLIAVMQKRYEEEKQRSLRIYCRDLYELDQHYRFKTPTNYFLLIPKIVSFCRNNEQAQKGETSGWFFHSERILGNLTLFKKFLEGEGWEEACGAVNREDELNINLETMIKKRISPTLEVKDIKDLETEIKALKQRIMQEVEAKARRIRDARTVKDLVFEAGQATLKEFPTEFPEPPPKPRKPRFTESTTDTIYTAVHLANVESKIKEINSLLESNVDKNKLEEELKSLAPHVGQQAGEGMRKSSQIYEELSKKVKAQVRIQSFSRTDLQGELDKLHQQQVELLQSMLKQSDKGGRWSGRSHPAPDAPKPN